VCDVISNATECMVWGWVRVREPAYSVWTEFTVPTGKGGAITRERNTIGYMHARTSCEQTWEQLASSRVNFCRITHTVQQSQPDDANPNTAESMVENAHRTGMMSVTLAGVLAFTSEYPAATAVVQSEVLTCSGVRVRVRVRHSTYPAATAVVQSEVCSVAT
jgi:hypothetical protein